MADGDALPDLYIPNMSWRLVEPQGQRFARSGLSQATLLSEPYWSFNLSTTWLDAADFQTWESWLIDRQGALSTFTAWRQDRPFGAVPVSSDSGLTVSAYDRAARTVSFGSTGTWTATKGDLISYYTAAGGYWLGMAMETKEASGGAMSALKVYPAPFAPHASSAAPRRIRALGEFVVRQPVPDPIILVDERRLVFSADQIIRG